MYQTHKTYKCIQQEGIVYSVSDTMFSILGNAHQTLVSWSLQSSGGKRDSDKQDTLTWNKFYVED